MRKTWKTLPAGIRRQLKTALLLVCAIATFAGPAFGGGYSALKDRAVISSAAAIEDVDLLLVGASAFGEARKVINASDNEAVDTFVANTETILSNKWQNIGLIVGAREALSGSTWSTYQSPITLSATEVATYGSDDLSEAYDKYKAFGYAVQNLNSSAQKSNTTAVSVDEGLDAMSTAAIKLGSFGVRFLNDYNPGPILIALYDYGQLNSYRDNKLVQIVTNNEILNNVLRTFGEPVAGTGISFFLICNALFAVFGFALSLFLSLLGNRSIGDGFRRFLTRIVIGTVGIYIVSNIMSTCLKWTTNTVFDLSVSETSTYVENNLNVYDWYLTGFALPSTVDLEIDSTGNFVFDRDTVRAINEYTYGRLTGSSGSDEDIQARMETYAQNGNTGVASFVTPSRSDGGEGSAWSTDAYYAIMDNYAQNKEDLLDGKDEEGSPLADKTSVRYASQYFWMSSLTMRESGDGWEVSGFSSSNFYGLNPISAFNLVRSDFSGETITSTSTVYPAMAYVAFDVVNVPMANGSTNMNSITRFIASFTLVLAAMKALITIFTSGFGGLISGGVKTATGSAHGLGQAIGGVIAIFGGIIGISIIMSMSLSLLDTIYGISKELLIGTELTEAFLQPLKDSLGKIPVLGPLLSLVASTGTDLVLTLILSLTFPKLGGIPIAVFAQYMSDIPAKIAEQAAMMENMLMSGRSSAGTGGGGRAGGGRYGQTAQAMAGRAFSSGAKQASAVMAAGVAGVGALAGASLATAGKALNKKADSMEGKPSNPGLGNWDDLTPEQQTKAADAAANTENWDQMDEEARQRVMEAAGVYEDGSATSGSVGDDANASGQTADADASYDSESADAQAAESMNTSADDVESVNASADSPDTFGAASASSDASAGNWDSGTSESPFIPPVTDADSMAGESMSGTDSMAGAFAGDGTQGADGMSGMNGASDHGTDRVHETGSSRSDSQSGESYGNSESTTQNNTFSDISSDTAGGSLNVEGSHVSNGPQSFHTRVDQNSHMDTKNVDESRSQTGETGEMPGTGTSELPRGENLSDPSGTSRGGAAAASAMGAASGMAGASGMNGATSSGTDPMRGTGGSRSGFQAGGSHGNSGNGTQSGASASYRSVNHTAQGDNQSNVNVNAQANQNTQFTAGADQSRSVNRTGTEGSSHESANGFHSDDRDRPGADPASGQSMNNGTSTSAWGRDMTIRQQRQARALHAVGNALQMAGGNRTMRQGIQDALGHAKDATIAYTVPEELGMTSFMTGVRVRRMEQNQRRNSRSNGK